VFKHFDAVLKWDDMKKMISSKAKGIKLLERCIGVKV